MTVFWSFPRGSTALTDSYYLKNCFQICFEHSLLPLPDAEEVAASVHMFDYYLVP